MSRRVRIGLLIAVIGVALAVGGVYVLSNLLRQALAPLPAPTQVAAITQPAVVTTHNISLGTILKSADLAVVDVPVELIPPGTFADPELVVGRFVKSQLVAGEMVLDHNLADPTNNNHDVGYIIGDNQVLMAFPADDLMSSLTIPQRGDIIDIFVSINETVEVTPENPATYIAPGEEIPTESRLFTFDAFQRIEVTAQVVDVVTQDQGQNNAQIPTTQNSTAAAGQSDPADYKYKSLLVGPGATGCAGSEAFEGYRGTIRYRAALTHLEPVIRADPGDRRIFGRPLSTRDYQIVWDLSE